MYEINERKRSESIVEASMKPAQIAALKKAYEPMRGKRISSASANKLDKLMNKFAKEKDLLIQILKADIPFVSTKAATILLFKHGMEPSEINKLKEEVELDEDMNALIFALWGGAAMVVLPALMIYDIMLRNKNSSLDDKVFKIVGQLLSKFKKDKNYKPNSAEIDASKKLEKEVKSKEPSIFKKAMSKLKSIKSKKESVELDEKTKWRRGDGRPRGAAHIENERFWDLPKSSLEYIIKDAGEAMRLNPTARKATTGRGNWADQVNDAHTVLGWRRKNGIKEEVELGEAIPKSTMYGVVVKGKVIAKGSKAVMSKLAKQKGGYVLNSPAAKVGDSIVSKDGIKTLVKKEEVDLDEDIASIISNPSVVELMVKGPFLLALLAGVGGYLAEPFKPAIKKIVDKLKKNKNYKISDSEKSDVKNAMSKLAKDNPSVLKKAVNILKKKSEQNEEVELDENVKFDNADFMLGFLVPWAMNPTSKYEPHLANYVKKLIPADNRQYAYKMIAQVLVKLIQGGMSAVQNFARQNKGAYDKMDKNVKKHLMKGLKAEYTMGEEVELDEKKGRRPSARADAMKAMRRSGEFKDKDDDDIRATDADVKAASKNILMQMKSAADLPKGGEIEFLDKKKVKVPQKVAQLFVQKYMSLRRPADKAKFQEKAAKSYKDFVSAMKEEVESEHTILDRIHNKIQERKNV